MSTRASIVHRTGSRIRLRVPGKRHDQGYFAALETELAKIPGLEQVVSDPRTASVLLGFAAGSGDSVTAALQAMELLSLEGGSSTRPRRIDRILPRTERARQLIAGLGASKIDRRTLAFAIFVALVVRQLVRKGNLAPALAFAWFLYEVYRHWNEHRKPLERNAD